MKEVTQQEYLKFINAHSTVTIEDTVLEIGKNWKIKKCQPEDFNLETTTVWSFPKRGDWATHYLNAKYRGNWAPQVPRNLILRYTEEGDTVLDAFVGSGTTLIEAKLLGRNAIGIDINEDAIMLTRDRLNFSCPGLKKTNIRTYVGDARNLDQVKSNSIDLVATHPPYVNIIKYSKSSKDKGKKDLSNVRNIREFAEEMEKTASEFLRVLKPNKYCAVLMGDTRRSKHVVPVSFAVMLAFLKKGFILKEHIIKLQHNMKMTGFWSSRSVKYNFLLLAHEHLFVFRKPAEGEDALRKNYLRDLADVLWQGDS